ncbi:MAG: invasion associated locus B family protein [Alphaproteobacteria bacterium]|nr:invasion associated locus B family protein [Alphaproteobacteria bacterium]MBV9903796.1 invasion associated locus B family protein [Alphaproteobacteria bacterium]
MRLLWMLLLLLAGLIGGFELAQFVPRGGSTTTITVFNDWRLVCPPPGPQGCELNQNLIDGRSGQAVARILVSGSSPHRVTLLLPYNLALDAGAAIAADGGTPEVLPYESCQGEGCIARATLDAAREDNMRSGGQGRIGALDLAGKPVVLPFSLRGFADGVDALERAEARRTQWWARLIPAF